MKPCRWIAGLVLLAGSTACSEEPVDALIRQLSSEDAAQRDAAENALIDGPETAEKPLREALPKADTEARVRIERILKWLKPEWTIDPETMLRDSYKANGLTPSDVSEVGAASPRLKALHRYVRFYTVHVEEPQPPCHVTVMLDITGACSPFETGLKSAIALLYRCRIRPVDEATLAEAAPAFLFLTTGRVVDPERVEVKDGRLVYHAHWLYLESRRTGKYIEDVLYSMEAGRLNREGSTGIPQATEEDIKRILDDPERWLEVDGVIREDLLEEIAKKQAAKPRDPPRHK